MAYWSFFKQTLYEWMDDNAPRLGAALAFYSILSLGPLLLLALATVGLVFGHEAAQAKIIAQLQSVIGASGAEAIRDIIANSSHEKETGVLAAIIGLITLLIGASGVFGQLQDALDTIWNVEPQKGRGFIRYIKRRFFSFAMVMCTGFLLLISLLVSTALAVFGEFATGIMEDFASLMEVINLVFSFGIITLLFALIFKYVPNTKIYWRDVWAGAALTAFLFTIGKFAIGLYLGRSGFSSSYGAAGSLVVVLVWVYYSSQILFFGAEFTQVYSQRYGSRKTEKELLP